MDIIPITSEPSSKFNIALEDGNFGIRLNFNGTSETWYMDISQNGEDLISGVNLLLGTDLLFGYNLGIGIWAMIDLDSTDEDATSANLGTKVVLIYIPESERGDLDELTVS